MYANRQLVKDHEFKVRVDAPTCDRVLRLSNGRQPAAYLREIIEAALDLEEQRQASLHTTAH